jgi:hypothetical protein
VLAAPSSGCAFTGGAVRTGPAAIASGAARAAATNVALQLASTFRMGFRAPALVLASH